MDQPMESLWNRFLSPEGCDKPIPKWIWNAPLPQIDAEEIRRQFKGFRDRDGYGGMMIVLWGEDGYFSEEYIQKYGQALDIAAELGLTVILWDENGFPTGFAGGELAACFPQYAARRLDMTAVDVPDPAAVDLPVPDGKLMAAVAMEKHTGERIDLTGSVTEGRLRCKLPGGDWEVLLFHCVAEGPFGLLKGEHRFMDYLNADAVGKFIELTHQRYFDRFPQHFGSTIRYAFYDEPSFWRLQGRIWTEGYNELFEAKYGDSPALLYPALWRDIGPDTAAARNALLGFRSELYATAFVGTLADWCGQHGIALTGHMDQEEIANPVPLSGDLMKVFERQHMPGVDEIMAYGRGSRAYKIVSSAAVNYDKPAVMSETFGAMGEDMPVEVLYKEAMDQFAKGVNFLVPHGTWYDNQRNVIFPPELSFRSGKFGPVLPAFHQYAARLSAVLRQGRPVADVAVLYPIASLVAGNAFGQGDAYLGGTIAGGTNYLDVGEWLSRDIRLDFHYLHPEVLDRRCAVRGAELLLGNELMPQQYRAMVLTGSEAIHWSNVQRILSFHEGGGVVIAAGRLPAKSAEFGHDGDVVAAMDRLFSGAADTGLGWRKRTSEAGGKAYHLPEPDARTLRAALEDALPVWDVRLSRGVAAPGGNLTCLHKRLDGMDIWFFANSGDTAVDTPVLLRGRHAPELWDPHTGERGTVSHRQQMVGREVVTEIRLQLDAVRSVFVVSG